MNKRDLEFLIGLQHRLNTQGNDGNADPLFWGVIEERKVPAYPGCGDGEELVIDSVEVFAEADLEELKEWIEETEQFEDDELQMIHNLNDAKEALEEKGIDCEIYPYSIEDVLSKNTGAFLTKEACQHHIKINGHNLCKPRTYAMTAFRNFEYEQLLKILKTTDFESLLKKEGNQNAD